MHCSHLALLALTQSISRERGWPCRASLLRVSYHAWKMLHLANKNRLKQFGLLTDSLLNVFLFSSLPRCGWLVFGNLLFSGALPVTHEISHLALHLTASNDGQPCIVCWSHGCLLLLLQNKSIWLLCFKSGEAFVICEEVKNTQEVARIGDRKHGENMVLSPKASFRLSWHEMDDGSNLEAIEHEFFLSPLPNWKDWDAVGGMNRDNDEKTQHSQLFPDGHWWLRLLKLPESSFLVFHSFVTRRLCAICSGGWVSDLANCCSLHPWHFQWMPKGMPRKRTSQSEVNVKIDCIDFKFSGVAHATSPVVHHVKTLWLKWLVCCFCWNVPFACLAISSWWLLRMCAVWLHINSKSLNHSCFCFWLWIQSVAAHSPSHPGLPLSSHIPDRLLNQSWMMSHVSVGWNCLLCAWILFISFFHCTCFLLADMQEKDWSNTEQKPNENNDDWNADLWACPQWTMHFQEDEPFLSPLNCHCCTTALF